MCSATIAGAVGPIGLAAAVALLPVGGMLAVPAGYYTGSGSCSAVIAAAGAAVVGAGGGASVIDCAGQARHFVLAGDGAALVGLRLVNGHAADAADPDGGCVLAIAPRAGVRNSTLANCTAARHGGGITANASAGARLTLVGVELTGGAARRGGGVWAAAGVAADGVRIAGCAAPDGGGGMFLQGPTASLDAAGLVLEENTAANGCVGGLAAATVADVGPGACPSGGVTRAHFLSALFVRVIVQRPNISSYREI